MLQTSTKDQLVLLLYNEVNVEERIKYLDAIAEDWQLAETYKELKKAFLALPRILKSPSKSAIQNILDYSKETQIKALA